MVGAYADSDEKLGGLALLDLNKQVAHGGAPSGRRDLNLVKQAQFQQAVAAVADSHRVEQLFRVDRQVPADHAVLSYVVTSDRDYAHAILVRFAHVVDQIHQAGLDLEPLARGDGRLDITQLAVFLLQGPRVEIVILTCVIFAAPELQVLEQFGGRKDLVALERHLVDAVAEVLANHELQVHAALVGRVCQQRRHLDVQEPFADVKVPQRDDVAVDLLAVEIAGYERPDPSPRFGFQAQGQRGEVLVAPVTDAAYGYPRALHDAIDDLLFADFGSNLYE